MAVVMILAVSCSLSAQTSESGFVLSIEGGKVYVDLGRASVSPGATLGVYDDSGRCVGNIIVEAVYDSYSSARPDGTVALSRLKEGMAVTSALKGHELDGRPVPAQAEPEVAPVVVHDNRASVIVPPAQVNDVVGVGYFGGYVADLLMEQLMLCDRVKLIDRSLFNAQVDEAEMAGSHIDPATAIERGKIAGARYAVQVTMQKPDVANVRTGIPLASIMGALQGGLNRNIGAQYMSNMEVARLKAAVSLSVRVIDLQTGEVMFMTSGSGKAEGDVQIGMEYGALGGAKLNDGADGFKQTVTGKAIQKAFITVGRHLDSYFSGRATKRVMGSASGFGRFDDRLDRRGMSLYSGVNKLSNDDLYSMFYDNKDLWFRYKSAKKQLRWSNVVLGAGIITVGVATATFASKINEDRYMMSVAAEIAGGAMVIGGVIMNIASHRKVEKVKNDYNNRMRLSCAGSDDCRLDFVAADCGGLGLRLSF